VDVISCKIFPLCLVIKKLDFPGFENLGSLCLFHSSARKKIPSLAWVDFRPLAREKDGIFAFSANVQ
jgi:hypothetical protein